MWLWLGLSVLGLIGYEILRRQKGQEIAVNDVQTGDLIFFRAQPYVPGTPVNSILPQIPGLPIKPNAGGMLDFTYAVMRFQSRNMGKYQGMVIGYSDSDSTPNFTILPFEVGPIAIDNATKAYVGT